MPHSPWWSNETSESLQALTKQVQEAFGVDHAYLYDAPFVDWLTPRAHLDAVRVFAGINGVGNVPSLPA